MNYWKSKRYSNTAMIKYWLQQDFVITRITLLALRMEHTKWLTHVQAAIWRQRRPKIHLISLVSHFGAPLNQEKHTFHPFYAIAKASGYSHTLLKPRRILILEFDLHVLERTVGTAQAAWPSPMDQCQSLPRETWPPPGPSKIWSRGPETSKWDPCRRGSEILWLGRVNLS